MTRLVLLLLVGCSAALPDPDSPGARVLSTCGGDCHRTFAPGSMTLEMWRVQIARMRREYEQRGIPWLTPVEERALLDYLTAHAGTS